MSDHYIFNEAGSIPGVPGTFAGVRVDVADDGSLDVQPLPLHPYFEAAEEEGLPEEEKASEEHPAEVSPLLEQPAPEAVSEHQPEEEQPKEEQVETTEPEQPVSLPEESPVLQETTQV